MDTGSGGTVDNVFDQYGRLTVANPGADKEHTYTFDAAGNLTLWIRPTYTGTIGPISMVP